MTDLKSGNEKKREIHGLMEIRIYHPIKNVQIEEIKIKREGEGESVMKKGKFRTY